MSLEILQTLATTSAAAAATATLASFAKRYFESLHKRPEQTVEDRIVELTGSLQKTSHLIADIESEINARTALATKLKEDVERYNHLKALNQQQVEAIAQTLRGELKVEGKKSFWNGFWTNFGFFALGAIFTLIMK